MDNPLNDLDSTQNNTESHWQTKCTNINEVFEHLFMNPIAADICFVPLLNASDPKKKFPAHKVVLIARSSVFLSFFEHNEAQNTDKKASAENKIQEMELPGIDPETFEELLRFCYTDKAKITKENAVSILQIANRFGILTLGAGASAFIINKNVKMSFNESEKIVDRRQTRKMARQTEAKQSSISKSIESLCMNPNGADICFIPLLNAEEPPKRFPAHKLILLWRSPVFQAQFKWDKMRELDDENDENEDAAEAPASKKAKKITNQIQEVELPDVEPEAIEQFLRFCYTDKAKFTAENVASVLYTANRYNVSALVKQAVKFIRDNVRPENAFEMLEFAHQLWIEEMKELEERALFMIRNHTKKALNSDGFLGVSQQKLDLITSQDFLMITEIELFQALIRWAMNRCEIPGNEEKTLRDLLGPALFRVQFGKMEIEDFHEIIVPTKVLTDAETTYISKKLKNNAYNGDDGSFFSDPECPFPIKFEARGDIPDFVKKGGRYISIDITKCSKIGTSSWEGKTPHFSACINGFTFFLVFEKQTNFDFQKNQPGRRNRLFVQCNGYEKGWSCWANVELILVSKTPGKNGKTLGKFSHRFRARSNSYNCSRFLPLFQELVDPDDGWIRDDTVTLKARVKLFDEPEEETKKISGKEET